MTLTGKGLTHVRLSGLTQTVRQAESLTDILANVIGEDAGFHLGFLSG